MSQYLYVKIWEEPTTYCGSSKLKDLFRDKYGNSNEITYGDMSWLEGVRDTLIYFHGDSDDVDILNDIRNALDNGKNVSINIES